MKTVYSKITGILFFVVSNTAFLLAAGNITHHALSGNNLVEDVPMDEFWVDEIPGIAADEDEIAEVTAPTATITTATTFMPISEGSLLARTRDLHRVVMAQLDSEEEIDTQAAMVVAAQFVEENTDLVAATDGSGATMLLHAVRRNYPIVVQAIASHSPDLIDLCDSSETSPRQAARDLRRMGILNWFNEHHPA